MTITELVSKISEILPNATIGDDNDGQIIIYTNLIPVNLLTQEETDELVDMDEVEDPNPTNIILLHDHPKFQSAHQGSLIPAFELPPDFAE